ncbi:IS6 family transposase, partial [Leptolyngbya sp. GB1-A1]|uniref:IS6 family transposase n=1 Tax=Leptolyngbya sp. GB1-A1 TaxID=2933908 RepID=UPI0032986F7F
IKVKGVWKYLYRAVDSEGNTLDFLLSAKRDSKAAARFLRKVLKGQHTHAPRVITVDKNAAYPVAIETLKEDEMIDQETELRQSKYLNNVIEQDHRNIKRIMKPMMGFRTFNSARRTLSGIEAMNIIRKGKVKGIVQGDIVSQVRFIEAIFGIAA